MMRLVARILLRQVRPSPVIVDDDGSLLQTYGNPMVWVLDKSAASPDAALTPSPRRRQGRSRCSPRRS